MKKPKVEDLTLRERIGQTAALRSNILARYEDTDAFFKANPYGNIWTTGKLKFQVINMADESDGEKDFYNDINN